LCYGDDNEKEDWLQQKNKRSTTRFITAVGAACAGADDVVVV